MTEKEVLKKHGARVRITDPLGTLLFDGKPTLEGVLSIGKHQGKQCMWVCQDEVSGEDGAPDMQGKKYAFYIGEVKELRFAESVLGLTFLD
jgi:hypothetical protein